MESKYTWLNGSLVPNEQATVPFLTNALHYGTAVFEGIRMYKADAGPAIFRFPEHVDRLADSAYILGIRELPYSVEEMTAAIEETIVANKMESCYIRPLIYLREGAGLNLDALKVGFGVAVWEWNAYLGPEALEKGIRANVSSYTRHHPNVTMTKAKISGNYANSVLARTQSLRMGFEEAILLDPSGFVAECSGENIFLVHRGKILTPPRATILEGITRDAVITLAQDLGYEVIEQPIARDHLYIADEVFVCGTAAEVVGLREIDYRKVGSGASGPVTRALQHAFTETVAGRGARSAEWLHYVTPESVVVNWPASVEAASAD